MKSRYDLTSNSNRNLRHYLTAFNGKMITNGFASFSFLS